MDGIKYGVTGTPVPVGPRAHSVPYPGDATHFFHDEPTRGWTGLSEVRQHVAGSTRRLSGVGRHLHRPGLIFPEGFQIRFHF